MYWTHHFAHHETMKRARSWLECLGFPADRIEVHATGVPRLAVVGTPLELAEVELLINAIERSDPHGWPSFWDVANQDHDYPVSAVESAHRATASVDAIGWHPQD